MLLLCPGDGVVQRRDMEERELCRVSGSLEVVKREVDNEQRQEVDCLDAE
jgi:hypothetical protein